MAVFTEEYRRQHQEILELVEQITKMLSPSYTPSSSQKIRELLSAVSGKINVHRAAEDNFLYPKLFVHNSEELRTLAKRYQDEILQRKEVVAGFFTKWRVPQDIINKAEEFNTETKNIFNGIRLRIDKEDNELFAMADRMN